MRVHEILEMYAKMLAVYDNAVTKTCQKYGLNHTCFDILIFLKNNPAHDTARAIEEKRGIKKSMASVAIEKLCQLGFLKRCPDEFDRRIQHLKLTEKSNDITIIGQKLQNEFQKHLFADVSEQEKDTYMAISEKLLLALNEMEGQELL